MNYFTNNKSSIVVSNRVLYTPSSFARSSLLHLQEIGELQAKKEHTSKRVNNLQSYLFFIVLSGAGELIYEGKNYSLDEGSCILIDCKKAYSHTTFASSLWTIRWCHFYGPTMSSIYLKYCERGGRPAFKPENKVDEFSEIWLNLMNMASSTDYLRDIKINALLSEMIACIMAESWHPEDKALPSKKASVMKIKQYLEENYSSRISLDDLCAKFFISKYYLTHSFKNQFGLSITNYILNVRITHAKQMLRFSNKTIEEIGYETGIGAPAYFSRVFKEVEGVSPKIYREQW